MSYNSCIIHAPKTRVVILREEFISFCNGNECAAIIISYFEYYHNQLIAQQEKRKELAIEQNINYETKESELYQQHSHSSIVKGILNQYQRPSVAEALDLLQKLSVISIIEWPENTKNINAKPRRYLFVPEIINQYITDTFITKKTVVTNITTPVVTNITTYNKESLKKEAFITKDVIKVDASRPQLIKRTKVVSQDETRTNLVTRIKPIYPSEDVKTLYQFWNNLSYPIPNHKENPETKHFQDACKRLSSHLKKYSIDQIKQTMIDYRTLLITDNTVIKLSCPGIIVSLADFFLFNIYTDKALVKIPQLEGVDCWFDECIKGWDYLLNKYSVCIKDDNPEVTKELAKHYREKINNNPPKPEEINIFIRATAKLIAYHNNIKGKLNFNSCPLEKESPKLFAHHMIDAIVSNTQNLTIVKVQWLVTDTHFNDRMTNYFKKIGMLDRDYQASNLDTLTEDMKKQQHEEYEEVRAWMKIEGEKINKSYAEKQILESEYNKQHDILMTEGKRRFAEIKLKYEGKITEKPRQNQFNDD